MAVLEFLEENHAGVRVEVNLQSRLGPVGNRSKEFVVIGNRGRRNFAKHIGGRKKEKERKVNRRKDLFEPKGINANGKGFNFFVD
jgi:hypothetical protein